MQTLHSVHVTMAVNNSQKRSAFRQACPGQSLIQEIYKHMKSLMQARWPLNSNDVNTLHTACFDIKKLKFYPLP